MFEKNDFCLLFSNILLLSSSRSLPLWKPLTAARFGDGRAVFAGAFLVEAVNATRGVYDALFARVERVAVRAKVETNLRHGAVRGHVRAARRTGHALLDVFGMDSGFHKVIPPPVRVPRAARHPAKNRASQRPALRIVLIKTRF